MRKILFLLFPLALFSAAFSEKFSVIKPEGECDMAEATEFELSSDNEFFAVDETSNQKITGMKFEGKTKTYYIKTGINRSFSKLPDNSMIENTPLLTINDPQIAEIAKNCLSSEDPVRAVKDSVFKIIVKKTSGFPILKAKDILKLKTGDCTEHAVLTGAVLRAMKIPAVGVAGVVYAKEFGKQRDVFVFHMWCEAYFGGKWIIVDSALPFNDSPNQYIALSYHNLKKHMPPPIDFASRMEKLKNFRIKAIR